MSEDTSPARTRRTEASRASEPASPSLESEDWGKKRPLYRAVEVALNAHGRFEKEGQVWHSDLNRARRFGRALAANTIGHKVQVVDGAGNLLEELRPHEGELPTGSWAGWQDLDLPPLPGKPVKAKKPPRLRIDPPKPAAPLPAAPVLPVLSAPPSTIAEDPVEQAAASAPPTARPEPPQLAELVEEIREPSTELIEKRR